MPPVTSYLGEAATPGRAVREPVLDAREHQAGRRSRAMLGRALPIAFAAIAFVHGAVISWRKLGSLLVDTGRELEVPREILQGRVLYQDVRFYWGPLGPYLNAGLYRVFGVSIDVIMWAGIAAAALMLVALYRLGTRFGGPIAGAAAGIGFVYMGAFPCVIGVPIFNFVLPFNCDATYGIVAATWSLVFLLDHLDSRRPAPFLFSALLLALTALAKIEVLLPTLAVHFLFALARFRHLRLVYACGWGAAVAAVAAVYAFFASRAPAFFADSLAGPVNRASDQYIRLTMGLVTLPESLRSNAWSLVSFAVIAVLAYALTRALALPVARRFGWALVVAFGVAVAVAEATMVGPFIGLRAMPIVAGAATVWIGFGWWRNRRDDWLAAGLVSMFALACFARIPLRSWPTHYGFYLLPPSFALLVALPALASERISNGAWMRRSLLAAACGVLVGVAFTVLQISRSWFEKPRVELHTAHGLLLVNKVSVEPDLVKALSRYPTSTRAIVVSEGIGLVFASGLQPGDGWVTYLPMHIPDDEHDAKLAAEWAANPPDVVVFWRRDLADFGYRTFGVDYGKRAAAVLERSYASRQSFHGGLFLLLERKP